MQRHNADHCLERCLYVADHALRWAMVHEDAQKRLSILKFFERHGLAATMEAFGVSRRTLYCWKARLSAQGGNPAALAPTSTAPTRRRSRSWPKALVDEIRQIRERHPNLGKEKIHVLLQTFLPATPSADSVASHHRPTDRRPQRPDASRARA